MPRKASRKGAKRQADTLFSKIVRARGYCQASGDGLACSQTLQCAHLEGRANHRLRWDEQNALSLCGGHHFHYTHFPILWTMFLQERFPEQLAYVMAHRNEMWDRDLDGVMARLKMRAKELEL